jgi:RNA polymerase-binding protein DksA
MKNNSSHARGSAPPHPSIPAKWTWHFQVLQSLRDRLLRDRDSQRDETIQPLVQDTNDMADCATDEFDHDLAFSLLSQEESALQEVDAAISRIQAGTYGICEETGKEIPDPRLRAIPWTRYQMEVQERLESEGLVKSPRLSPASDIHGPLVRNETPPGPQRAPRRKTKSERRSAGGKT